MDVPVNKILEALTPALTSEIQQILSNVGQQHEQNLQAQEQEFRSRLESAVREAETAVRTAADGEKDQAIAQAREAMTAELNGQFGQTLQQAMDGVRADFASEAQANESRWTAEKNQLAAEKTQLAAEKAELETQKAALDAEIARLKDEAAQAQAQADLWRTYAEAQQQLGDSASQAEMLNRYLNLAEPFAPGVAVYVAKPGGLELWKSRGTQVFPSLATKETLDPETYFKPLTVREKVVAAVCARGPYKTEPIEYLSACLGRAIEAYGMKMRTPAPRPPEVAAVK